MTDALTEDQRNFLSRLKSDGDWTYQCIARDGTRKWLTPVRQECKRQGLAESHPSARRNWRITDKGRLALGAKMEPGPNE